MPVGVLVNDTEPSHLTACTRPPVTAPVSYPFAGWSVSEVWDFARTKLGTGETRNEALAILDKRTLLDQTSLLVTQHQKRDGSSELLTVSADFASSLVCLQVVNLGIGGEEHFLTLEDKGFESRPLKCLTN